MKEAVRSAARTPYGLGPHVDESMMPFLRNSTRLPTIFSRSSDSSEAWWSVSMFARSSEKVWFRSG